MHILYISFESQQQTYESGNFKFDGNRATLADDSRDETNV